LKVEKEQLDASHWQLTVEAPTDDAQAELEAELQKMQQQSELPGFRKGKVPLSLVRQRYAKALEVDLLRKRLMNFYDQAVKEAGIPDPVALPDIEVKQFEIGQPLIFTAKVEVEPPVELAPFEDLTVVRERIAVSEEDVDKHLERLREHQAVLQDTEDPAGADSLLEVDLQELDAALLPMIGRKREGVVLDLGKSSPEFRASLEGVQAGQSRNVSLSIPTMQPNQPPRTESYQVNVKSVKRKELPEVNDEFARSLGPDIQSVQDLREVLKRQIQAEADRVSFQRVSHLLVHQIVDHSRLDVPESMINNYLDRLVENARASAQHNDQQGPVDEVLIRDRYRGQAVWNLKWYLIRKRIAEREGLTVGEDELQREFEQMATATGKKLKQIQALYDDARRRENLVDDMLERKILGFLMSKAQVVERTVPYEEFFARDQEEHEHTA